MFQSSIRHVGKAGNLRSHKKQCIKSDDQIFSLTHQSPSIRGHRGVVRGPVAQPPGVAASAAVVAVFVVVVLVTVGAPFAVRKVGPTKLGHVLGEEDVLRRERESVRQPQVAGLRVRKPAPGCHSMKTVSRASLHPQKSVPHHLCRSRLRKTVSTVVDSSSHCLNLKVLCQVTHVLEASFN